ncbi:hypothetical protein, conserved [Trypanosoma brucei gambiense DAL972]|uniref:Uncharacterized protein n=2 Tax=Trypanosoma brucei TaxID=5691 RepID=D0A4P7_TRYB9|nr:hypothetical protein, conserved [Trypanosoma brucei gambiense DAL972]CBH16241.1 hypothetical protein, conserved [Trypanosoma brucei gambiense DAL972]|eukprot:XP_011778505.1 hypothetical protein, conserved [Trypanosoma brucei gambiense DAL972]
MGSPPPPYDIVFPLENPSDGRHFPIQLDPPPSYDSLDFSTGHEGVRPREWRAAEVNVSDIIELKREMASLRKKLDSFRVDVGDRPRLGEENGAFTPTKTLCCNRSVSKPLPFILFPSVRCCCCQTSEVKPMSDLSPRFRVPSGVGPQQGGSCQSTFTGEEEGGECVEGAASFKGAQINCGCCVPNASLESAEGSLLDVVDLLTTFYNLPPPACWRCRETLPNSFGEELLASALGTTSDNLLDRYASLLVERLNKSVIGIETPKHTERKLSVLRTEGTTTSVDALAHLPYSVLGKVLENTGFPNEIMPYKIACAACELHFTDRTGDCVRFASASRHTGSVSHTSTRVDKPESVPDSNCTCKEGAIESLLCSVRFLWLPARFLESELRRYEVLLPTIRGRCCATYSGFLLRLGQAAKLKSCLRSSPDSETGPFQDGPFSDILLSELRRLRPSYDFLTTAERHLVLGENVTFSLLRKIQGKCDASE